MRRGLGLLCALGLLVVAAPVVAQESTLYAKYLGDGMRFYAEGSYTQAVENLYRAYALKADPNALKFIIRAYDLMGHCSAAQRQLEMFNVTHPGNLAPPLQQCLKPAMLHLECVPEQSAHVQISPQIRAQCGQSIALPPGEYKLASTEMEVIKTVRLSAGESLKVNLRITPKKWTTARLEDEPRVSRVDQDAPPYIIIMSDDGLYQVFSPEQQQVKCTRDDQGRRICTVPRLPKGGQQGVGRVD